VSKDRRSDDLQVRPGRVRDRGVRARPKTFVGQVLAAAQKAGHVGKRSRPGRAPSPGRSTFGRGRGVAFGGRRLLDPTRRVLVKARIMRHRGQAFRAAPLSAHVAYLRREGVARDGEKAKLFDAGGDTDEKSFVERCAGDRHHFRFIVSPEEASDLTDLKAFTRDLLADMERDLGTRLDWVAVEHWNTDNPHVHLLVRGRAGDGRDLVISRDYITRGMRERAEHLVTIELGRMTERAVWASLDRDVGADRWTRLDTAIRRHADDTGLIDLRMSAGDGTDPEIRRRMIGRLQRLEQMGLARPEGAARWSVAPDAEFTLRDLGARRDIIAVMHRAAAEQGIERPIGDFVIHDHKDRPTITGRLIAKGLHDELGGEAYAVIDGVDGRLHHVRFPDLDRLEHAPPVGGIAAVRHLQAEDGRRSNRILSVRSDLTLEAQVTANGATWLDHQLLVRDKAALSEDGFGREVRDALDRRVDHLIGEGLARRQGGPVVFARELLATLRRRDLDAAAARITAETGLAHRAPTEGDSIGGVYRQRLTLASGRFAMIDDGLGFALVPWRPSLEPHIGRQVSGLVRAGGIDWALGRQRGLGI
jgi:type IV secretory pathway VirD2 relaxase